MTKRTQAIPEYSDILYYSVFATNLSDLFPFTTSENLILNQYAMLLCPPLLLQSACRVWAVSPTVQFLLNLKIHSNYIVLGLKMCFFELDSAMHSKGGGGDHTHTPFYKMLLSPIA